MRKNIKKFAGIVLCIGMFTGCAQTPDSSLVKPKGSKAVDAYTEADDVSGSKGEASESKNDDGSESKITIRNLIDAPQNYKSHVEDDSAKLVVNTDASVEIPEVEKISAISVTAAEVTQELLDRITNAYSTKSLLKYLERYENFTGSRYQDVFWKKSEPELYAVFNRLILHGILDGKKYLEEFVKDYKNEEPDLEKKWEFMAGYLKSEIKGLCNEHSYPMLKFLINEIGMDGCEFLSPWRILKETFSLGYYAIQHRECEFFSPVLGKKEHRELFSMVEKKFFYEYPDIYPEYLTALLLKESTALWLEQSEAYELSKLLLPFISDSYRRETLYQKYMTEEDRKRYQERKEWLKEQKKRIDHWKTEKNIKQQFNQILRENRKTDKEIQSIYEFYKNGRYSYGHKKLYCKIVSSYLKDNFAGTVKKLMAKKEALYLLKLAENMYQDECMGLPEITELIERAEVA